MGGDDALRLPADVEQDLVLVDADDRAGDDLALVEVRDRRVVVGEDLSVELEQQAVGAVHRSGSFGCEQGAASCLDRRHSTRHDGKERNPAAARPPTGAQGSCFSPSCR